MLKEEAMDRIKTHRDPEWNQTRNIIIDIYSDFNSMACHSCKHFFSNGLTIECWNDNVCKPGDRLILEGTSKDFGCNKFEGKDK